MKVCYLINQLAPGGAPTLLLDIVRKTDNTDIDFTVAFIEGDDSLVTDFEKAGANIVRFNADFKFDPRGVSRLLYFFHKNSFDIVHAHLPYAQTLGRIGSLVGNHRAVISTQHNFPQYYHPITRSLERFTRPIEDMTVGVSKAVVEDFVGSAHHPRWRVIYNGANIGKIRTELEEAATEKVYQKHSIHSSDHIILNVGRYVEEKNQKEIIRAFSRENLSAHLIIVGWGEKKDELRKAANDYGVEDRVTVTGRILDVWPYYAISDTFVSASKSESFGIVYLEAMAAELPIIGTDVPGASEVLEEAEEGVLSVPPNDIDALGDALSQYVHDSPQTDYYDALGIFDINKIASEHIDLYQEVLEEE